MKVIKVPLKRVPSMLTTPKISRMHAGTKAKARGPRRTTCATYAVAPTASAAATPGYMTMELIQP